MKINYAAYINSQKMRVRADREDELELLTADGQSFTIYGGARPIRDSREILSELDGLRGLNVGERMSFRRPSREGTFTAAWHNCARRSYGGFKR